MAKSKKRATESWEGTPGHGLHHREDIVGTVLFAIQTGLVVIDDMVAMFAYDEGDQ